MRRSWPSGRGRTGLSRPEHHPSQNRVVAGIGLILNGPALCADQATWTEMGVAVRVAPVNLRASRKSEDDRPVLSSRGVAARDPVILAIKV